MVKNEYKFPVYATQGGGKAREVNGAFVFIEAPDCPGLDVGDIVPQDWDIAPANKLARHEKLKQSGVNSLDLQRWLTTANREFSKE